MAWTTADIPDQSGRVAVVTGANGGLGLEVARELARRGARVVMAARDQAKAAAAEASIRAQVPDALLELRPLDLASQASVGEAAAAILADHSRVDLRGNNAGVRASAGRTELPTQPRPFDGAACDGPSPAPSPRQRGKGVTRRRRADA